MKSNGRMPLPNLLVVSLRAKEPLVSGSSHGHNPLPGGMAHFTEQRAMVLYCPPTAEPPQDTSTMRVTARGGILLWPRARGQEEELSTSVNRGLCHQARMGSSQRVMSPWGGLPRTQRSMRSTVDDLSMASRRAR